MGKQKVNAKEGEEGKKKSLVVDLGESPKLNPRLSLVRRKSSFLNRGKRQSTFGPNSIGFPHPTVPISSFYSHIDTSLPPPVRLNQLVSWCIQRNLQKQKSNHKDALVIAKKAETQLLRLLIQKKISLGWYARPKTKLKGTLPNPKNLELLEKKRKLTQAIQKLEMENQSWKEEIKKCNQVNKSINLSTTQPSTSKSSSSHPLDILPQPVSTTVSELNTLLETISTNLLNDQETQPDQFNLIEPKLNLMFHQLSMMNLVESQVKQVVDVLNRQLLDQHFVSLDGDQLSSQHLRLQLRDLFKYIAQKDSLPGLE